MNLCLWVCLEDSLNSRRQGGWLSMAKQHQAESVQPFGISESATRLQKIDNVVSVCPDDKADKKSLADFPGYCEAFA